MLTVVPWTDLRPEVVASLAGLRTRYERMADDRAYWWLLRRLWDRGEAFTVVEHDVVPSPGTLQSMWACPRDWCAAPYRVGAITATGLGCTKFEAPLIARHPDLLRSVPDRARHWDGLDAVLIGELNRRGERVHEHEPTAIHLHREATMSGDNRVHRLRWIGDGSRYLHEDASAGIPPMPPTDFETADERVASVAVGSGLYVEEQTGDTHDRRGKRAAAPDAAGPEAVEAEAE